LRKGARRIADIPPLVMQAINRGELETVNLVEYLAADLQKLLPAVAQQIGLDPEHPELLVTVDALPGLKPMQRHRAIAKALLHVIGDNADCSRQLAGHRSDLARQWAALFAGLRPNLTLTERLQSARPFAADLHFAVREMAWLAVRDAVAADVPAALALLQPWSHESDPNLRRFASELTRPRGVWCVHLESLKADPAPALALLEPLHADPSRYVQNSVGNWLNDAAKSAPAWVAECSARWLEISQSKATAYICRRGLRTLKRAAST
jgi:3-methyladenine DNA glycosylase AlkC